jgi:spore coat polysaccharide biosynthesis predicted glycosyltransferase SpsG
MTTTEHLINYHWWCMETALNHMFDNAPHRRNNNNSHNEGGEEGKIEEKEAIISTCVIIDLQGLHMHHTTNIVLDHVKAMIALDNACYPEVLGKMLVINAPWLAGKYDHSIKRQLFYFLLIFFTFYYLFTYFFEPFY